MDRFYVATVTGRRIHLPVPDRGSNAPPGVSAHVLDRAFNCRVVAEYHSEDRIALQNWRTRGIEGALRDARCHAAYLNERYG